MRIVKYFMLIALFIASAHTMSLTAKNITVPKMYMFGFAASFNDSIVHFTDIQTLDNVWIDQKTHFLLGRENFSYQLRDFLADKMQMPHRTCVVIYNQDRQKLEKEYLKMKRIYTTGKKKIKKKDQGKIQSHNELRMLPSEQFTFQVVDMSGQTNE
ncbi:MAG: hypothetical protein J6P41_01370 [Prevotella sp.]|nr:hypothetical protein [Prevotella sp.]